MSKDPSHDAASRRLLPALAQCQILSLDQGETAQTRDGLCVKRSEPSSGNRSDNEIDSRSRFAMMPDISQTVSLVLTVGRR
jgi:hypothetical protein